jgi:hypothetical protein
MVLYISALKSQLPLVLKELPEQIQRQMPVEHQADAETLGSDALCEKRTRKSGVYG